MINKIKRFKNVICFYHSEFPFVEFCCFIFSIDSVLFIALIVIMCVRLPNNHRNSRFEEDRFLMNMEYSGLCLWSETLSNRKIGKASLANTLSMI